MTICDICRSVRNLPALMQPTAQLAGTERRVEALSEEVDSLQRSREKIFRPPPVEWIRERLSDIQSVLEQRTARSAQMLRNLLGPIRLELQTPDIGRPFYCAVTSLDALALIETPPNQSGAEGGSNTLQRWTRTQRIRTAASIPVVVTIVDAGSTPAFLEIAAKAAHLRELGMSDRAIARAIGVSDKTVAKSLRRFRIDENLGTVDEALGPEGD